MRGQSLRLIGLFAVACAAAVFNGCGPNYPERAEVHGIIFLDGKPLTKGTVRFYPASGTPARGTINEKGYFTLTTFQPDDGAVLGEHVVTVKSTEVGGESAKSLEEEIEQVNAGEVDNNHGVKWLAPERYSRRGSTDLKATVEKGVNEIEFRLTTKP